MKAKFAVDWGPSDGLYFSRPENGTVLPTRDRPVWIDPMFRIFKATPLTNFRLQLRFEDGVEGEVDLSDLAGRGVFAIWDDPEVFSQVVIGEHGELVWPNDVDLCADSLYLRLTGKAASEIFPGLKSAAHA